jgi:hypothetical protein
MSVAPAAAPAAAPAVVVPDDDPVVDAQAQLLAETRAENELLCAENERLDAENEHLDGVNERLGAENERRGAVIVNLRSAMQGLQTAIQDLTTANADLVGANDIACDVNVRLRRMLDDANDRLRRLKRSEAEADAMETDRSCPGLKRSRGGN